MSVKVSEARNPTEPRGERTSVRVLPDDEAREAYLDSLFRELDEDFEGDASEGRGGSRIDATPTATLRTDEPVRPGGAPTRRVAGLLLLAVGLVLITGGLTGALLVPAPEIFLSVVLGVNVVAVLCVAVGVLLLPERPAPG